MRVILTLPIVSLLLFRSLPGADPAPASVTNDANSITLANGAVSITIAKRGGTARNGEGISIKYNRAGEWVELSDQKRGIYFDAGGDRVYPVSDADVQVVHETPAMVEAVWKGEPTAEFPFATEMHIAVHRGEPGFYLYAIYRHGAGMAAGTIGETRFVLRGVPGTTLFTNHIVDDNRKGPFPTAPRVATVQDATSLLADGTIYTKYNNAAFLAEHHVHGMAGHGLGMWMISPSNEYIGGGPFKQELTVHQGNTLLSMFVGGHFGSGACALPRERNGGRCTAPFSSTSMKANRSKACGVTRSNAPRKRRRAGHTNGWMRRLIRGSGAASRDASR